MIRLGRDTFYNKCREKYANITRREAFDFLKKQETYQLHLIQPRERVVKPMIDKKINSRWQIDHIYMKQYFGPHNNNAKYFFVAIDVFSKYAFARYVSTKESCWVIDCLDEFFLKNYELTGEHPKIIHSDNAAEFNAKELKDFLSNFNVKQIHSPGYLPQMQGIVERFNRTLKNAIHTNFTKNRNNKYTFVLQDIVDEYNNTVHTFTKDTPARIHRKNRKNITQVKQVEKRQEEWSGTGREYSKLRVGSKVHIHIYTSKAERKKLHKKKFLPQWSKIIYKIDYIMNEGSDKLRPKFVIRGREYFRHELQKV